MSNEKHYPLHPNQSHPPIMTCEIPLEEYESLKRENERLKNKLEDVQATAYAESVDAGMENRKLKRALWLARADRAVAAQSVHEWCRYNEKHPCGLWKADPFECWVQAWICVEKLCRKKAKEYK